MVENELAQKEQEIAELKAKLKMLEDIKSLKGQIDEKRDIPFQSLTFSRLILQTGKLGDTEPEIFTGFGEVRMVDHGIAKEIIRRNKKFIQKGYVWIDDEDFIKKEHLESAFENVVSKKKLKEIASCKDRDIFEKDFVSLPDGQKQAVLEMVHKQYKKGTHDLRIIGSINNMLNIDLIKDIERFEELMKPTVEVIK